MPPVQNVRSDYPAAVKIARGLSERLPDKQPADYFSGQGPQRKERLLNLLK